MPFHYKRFLGYRRGSDGKPEIDPEQAVTVKRIYERFLAGDSLATIANDLNADGILTPSGVGQWQRGTIESILTNEKYKGDAILNKSRLDEIFTIIEALANHPISYDDQIVRQILESVIVESKEKIKVVFVGGLEVTQTM